MITPSEMFFDRTQRRSVYNIHPIENIPSVIRYGILSYNRAAEMRHESIAMPEVQNR